jgi:hypothetical protein
LAPRRIASTSGPSPTTRERTSTTTATPPISSSLGELRAREADAAPYNARTFRRALERVRGLTRTDDFSDELLAVCAEAGVVVVLVKEIGECRVSGAAWWLNADAR